MVGFHVTLKNVISISYPSCTLYFLLYAGFPFPTPFKPSCSIIPLQHFLLLCSVSLPWKSPPPCLLTHFLASIYLPNRIHSTENWEFSLSTSERKLVIYLTFWAWVASLRVVVSNPIRLFSDFIISFSLAAKEIHQCVNGPHFHFADISCWPSKLFPCPGCSK